MALERQLSLSDYVRIIRRRLPYVLGFFFPALLIATVLALKQPFVYESAGTILIESQQVQPGLVKDAEGTETFATERIEILKQLVLTRENLLRIANKFSLFGLDKNPKRSPDSLASAVRQNIKINLIKADAGQYSAQSTLAFQISFQYYKPDIVYEVTNDLVNLFLEGNKKVTFARANETAEFLGKEADKQGIALEKIEKQVTDYKQRHSLSLPENKVMQVASLERLETDLRATQRDYSATKAELRSLDVALESAKAGIGLNAAPAGSATELEGLKLELAKQSSIYSENHPSIRALKRRIEAIENNSRPSPAGDKPVTQQSVMVATVLAQIETANARLKSLETEEKSIHEKVRQTEGSVIQSTQTEGELSALLRDYENAKTSYEDIKSKLTNAKMAQNIEQENKGERFVLIEAPVLPEKPLKPNRIMLLLGGLFGSIGGAIGFAILLEKLDKRVRGADVLASIMHLQPIVVIPYITTKAEIEKRRLQVFKVMARIVRINITNEADIADIEKRRLLVFKIVARFVGTIVLVLLIVHYFVIPLNELIAKIAAKF